MKGKTRRYGKLCWLYKIEYDIAEACSLFLICTATLCDWVHKERGITLSKTEMCRLVKGYGLQR